MKRKFSNRFPFLSAFYSITDTFMVYSACGQKIYAWRRGSELKHTYSGHTKNVRLVLPFGPNLISVDESSTVKVNNQGGTHYSYHEKDQSV